MTPTPPDPSEAGRRAVAARQARAAIKQQVSSGGITAATVLGRAEAGDEVAGSLLTEELLRSLPGIGVARTARALETMRISPRRRLRGLGPHQRARLRSWLEEVTTMTTHRPRLVILAGPTAVGKGTVAAYIREHYPQIVHSVSATTRNPRPGEVDGVHYRFVAPGEFDRMVDAGEFLEWATVHNAHRYGTPRASVQEQLDAGRSVLLEIDLQGARQVRAAMPEALLIFLAPPSWEELERRLVGRGTEGEEERTRRLETARVELSSQGEFDHVVVNASVPEAAAAVAELILGSPEAGAVD